MFIKYLYVLVYTSFYIHTFGEMGVVPGVVRIFLVLVCDQFFNIAILVLHSVFEDTPKLDIGGDIYHIYPIKISELMSHEIPILCRLLSLWDINVIN